MNPGHAWLPSPWVSDSGNWDTDQFDGLVQERRNSNALSHRIAGYLSECIMFGNIICLAFDELIVEIYSGLMMQFVVS